MGFVPWSTVTAALQAMQAGDSDLAHALLAPHAPPSSPPLLSSGADGTTSYGRHPVPVYPLAGQAILALRDLDGRVFARGTLPDGAQWDALWRHNDLRVVIPNDEEVALYRLGDEDWVMDHAPATLGKVVMPIGSLGRSDGLA